MPEDRPLVIAGTTYRSRLLTGTGKYRDLEQTREATEAAGAEIVTVAIRRSNIGQDPDEPNLLDVLPPDRYTILPNTAGCYSAEEAVRTCRLARELLDGHKLVKLEVLGDERTLFPDVPETLKAAEILVEDGFDVMVYTNDDPIIARRLAEMGCCAVMPLAAPIGSGLGIQNRWNILSIVEDATVPILVDAGVVSLAEVAQFNADPERWYDYRDVRRSIFMGDYIYAISDRGVTVHGLGQLGLVTQQSLPGYSPNDWYWWW